MDMYQKRKMRAENNNKENLPGVQLEWYVGSYEKQ